MDLSVAQIAQTIAVAALPLVFAITLHEAAHGYVARYFGDLTAYAQGRVSLNPLRHIDLAGTLVVPVLILALSGGRFIFGWAKPVPVNFGNLRRPKHDMLWVAAAGPGANLAMALAWALVLKAAVLLPAAGYAVWLVQVAKAGVVLNVVFMVLNLLPVPPLDGGRIAFSLLPNRAAYHYGKLEPYGLIIVLALLVIGALGTILWPFIFAVIQVIGWLVGVPPVQILSF
ncbi:MAG: site-2 protease family protein [Pseudomonadota bacterium]